LPICFTCLKRSATSGKYGEKKGRGSNGAGDAEPERKQAQGGKYRYHGGGQSRAHCQAKTGHVKRGGLNQRELQECKEKWQRRKGTHGSSNRAMGEKKRPVKRTPTKCKRAGTRTKRQTVGIAESTKRGETSENLPRKHRGGRWGGGEHRRCGTRAGEDKATDPEIGQKKKKEHPQKKKKKKKKGKESRRWRGGKKIVWGGVGV